ncbi:MAG: hypothetical protein ACKO5Q_28715, partial [Microcystaceae cyanobacterium]
MLNSVLAAVYQQLTAFASWDSFWSKFDTVFGADYNFLIAQSLWSQWQGGDFSQLPAIQVVSDEVLGNARGAYASSSNVIYLAAGLVEGASPQVLEAVILEEIGHFVDTQVNGTDTAGDEGELFSTLVQEKVLSAVELSRIKTENDHTVVMINGQATAIEMANATAIQLNGVNQQVDLGTWFNYQNFTVEIWVKAGNIQVTYADIIDNNHTDYRSWVVQQNANTTNSYYFGVIGSPNAGVSFDLIPGKWQHLA